MNSSFPNSLLVIAMVNMLVLLLPPTAGEKITLGAFQFLIISIFLLYFHTKLPPLGDHLPLLGKNQLLLLNFGHYVGNCACCVFFAVLLYVMNLVLVSISLGISVIVLNLSRTRRVSSPPYCLRVLCNDHFATLLGLGHLRPFVRTLISSMLFPALH